mmetsp:Transcript_60154/g.105361  ORF Transcript_60154/g.105361 Transcript_60154/m.105361 type:complete len:446 (+) Transcript_60154:87-1424(+)
MVRITDEQIEQYKKHGYLIVPNFLTPEETEAAQNGFFSCYADRWEERGKTPSQPKGQMMFPWTDPALNQICTHPDLIDACERVIGSKEIRLCEAHCGIKYAEEWKAGKVGGTSPEFWHQDYTNNTIGPALKPSEDDFQQIICFYLLTDVKPGMAPIQMLSNTKDDVKDAEKVIVPAGSACFYTVYTYHAASQWDVKMAPTGHRASMHVSYCNSNRSRMWDGARFFTIKSGANETGIGECMTWLSPRQLNAAFMLPMPGDPLWTDDFLTKWCNRWPGFDRVPYDKMREGDEGEKPVSKSQLRIFRKDEMTYLVPEVEARSFVQACSKLGWAHERVCCKIPTAGMADAVSINCFRKDNSALYCHSSWDGRENLSTDGWQLEKETAFLAFPPDAAPSNTLPVHEWSKDDKKKFYYTMEDWSGYSQMENWGWAHERIAFYVPGEIDSNL